jgi:hypothetical protein
MKKQDFLLSTMLKDYFRIGVLVIFVDNSYVTDIHGHKASPTFDSTEIFKIVEGNKAFPTDSDITDDICYPINNIKVQDIVTGKFYFCSGINIKSLFHGKSQDKFREDTVHYKGELKRVSEVFVVNNPYPYL